MAEHISVRNVEFTGTPVTVRIVVTTDIPCHLYCRLTSKRPWIHKKPSLRRGVQFAEDVRFCFTVFEDNEQMEPGDTLTHTWLKPDWIECQTKHCYFWGYVGGILSQSSSPIFTYHNTAPLIIWEPWTRLFAPEPDLELYFEEPWGGYPAYTFLLLEEWTRLPVGPPGYEQYFVEEWSS